MSLSLANLIESPLALLLIAVLIACTFLSCVWAFKRLSQQKGRATLVVLANLAFSLCILILALDIKVTDNISKTVVLLTSGTTTGDLSQLPKNAVTYTLDDLNQEITHALANNPVKHLDSLSQLLAFEADISDLHILGAGLSEQHWQDLSHLLGAQLDTMNILFSPAEPTLGLVDMRWQKEAVVGEVIKMTGRLVGPMALPDKIYTLDLIDPVGGLAGSIRLKNGESFVLSVAAKSEGKWLYRLQLKTPSADTLIADEPLAFSVSSQPELKLLIKQSAPSFETRQLKNWASEFGAKISVLTQISQNKDIRQNVNFSPQELAKLSDPLSDNALALFDLLVIDGRSLMALSAQQMQSIKKAITLGLGLYVVIDQQLVDAWPVAELDWLGQNSLRALNTDSHFSTPVWPHSQIEEAIPVAKAELQAAQTLVSSQRGEILVAPKNLGLGKVALSLINSSYGWKTAGLSEQYSHFWQHIFAQLSRAATPPYWIPPAENAIQWLGQRYKACMITDADKGEIQQTNLEQSLPLIGLRDTLQHEKVCVTSWLDTPRWQQFSWSSNQPSEADIKSFVYIYQAKEWQVWRHAQRIEATKQFIQNRTAPVQKDNLQLEKALDKRYVWWALILLGSFLWLERKLFSD